MKNIKLLVFSLVVALGSSSCENSLDLTPQDSQTPIVVFSTKAQAMGALNGMYSQCQSKDVLSGVYDAMTEWQSDNVKFVGSFPTFNEISLYSTLSDNSSISRVFSSHYNVINQANMLIKYVPLINDINFTPAEKDDVVGQALFVRALMHFKLSQCFGIQYKQNPSGLSVPYITVPYEGDISRPSRLTISQVYSNIETDLLSAVSKITNVSRTKATSNGAKALLARLYLYKDDFANAATLADEVITSGSSTFATDFSFYNDITNDEHVFVLSNISSDAPGNESFSGLFNGTDFNGRGDCPFSQNLKDLFLLEPSDIRYSAVLTRNGNNALAASDLFTNKYPSGSTKADDPNVIRISEMYLIRGEANFRGGTLIGGIAPLTDINMTRNRADLPGLVTLTLTDILNERRKEFCFEGLRRMDLLRNNLSLRPVSDPQFTNSSPTSNKVVFPIPQRDIDLNSNLVQNFGY